MVALVLFGIPLVNAKTTKKQTNNSDQVIQANENIMTMSTRDERECIYRSSTLAWRISARLGPTTMWCVLESEEEEKAMPELSFVDGKRKVDLKLTDTDSGHCSFS